MLAAPCCHHDIATQLRSRPAPAPYDLLTRQGILRERFADVLTDALRAALLRSYGYRVEVVEFVDSKHTPRNLLLRARRARSGPPTDTEYRDLVAQWQVSPRLETLLARPAVPRLAAPARRRRRDGAAANRRSRGPAGGWSTRRSR